MIKKQFRFVFLALLLFAATTLTGQSLQDKTSVYDSLVLEAFLDGDMRKWENIIEKMERQYKQNPDADMLFHLTTASYGLTGYLLGNDEEDRAEDALDKTIRFNEKLAETSYKSESQAILAGTYGYKISMSPFKAVFFGRKNQNAIDKAMELDSSNPMAWMEKGNAYYHMPGMFGGSYEKAITHYAKSTDLYEDRSKKYPEWLRMNTLVWLAKSHAKNGNREKAVSLYRKVLEMAPGFKWVKEELLPEVE